VNNDGLHASRSVSATVNVTTAGSYPIAITFFEQSGGEIMQAYWSGPGIARQLIPNAVLTQTSVPSNIVLPAITGVNLEEYTRAILQPEKENTYITEAYPNPFTKGFIINFHNTAPNNKINIGVYDLTGRLLLTRNFGNLSPGRVSLEIDPNERPLAHGIYLVKIDVNGMPLKIIKMVKAIK